MSIIVCEEGFNTNVTNAYIDINRYETQTFEEYLGKESGKYLSLYSTEEFGIEVAELHLKDRNQDLIITASMCEILKASEKYKITYLSETGIVVAVESIE